MRDNHNAPTPVCGRTGCKASPLAHLLLTLRGARTATATITTPGQQAAAHPHANDKELSEPSLEVATLAINRRGC